jgi:two-component system, NarL family, nitrate/nitrite response regulator NarL
LTGANVLLIDPVRLVRESLGDLLESNGFPVVAETDRMSDVPRRLAATIDLVVVDPGVPSDTTFAEVEELRAMLPKARIVVLAAEIPVHDAVMFLRAGVDGCLVKQISMQALKRYLELVMAGEKVLPTACLLQGFAPSAEPDMPPEPEGIHPSDKRITASLSRREREIIGHLVDGASNKMIANALDITEATVKVHLKAIMKKTRAANRTQVAIWASRTRMTGEPRRAAPHRGAWKGNGAHP